MERMYGLARGRDFSGGADHGRRCSRTVRLVRVPFFESVGGNPQ